MHQFSYRIQFHFGHKYVCVFSFVAKSHYSRLLTYCDILFRQNGG